MPRPLRILHCHSTFSLGGKEARCVRLMNAFGERAEHAVLSAMPGRLEARAGLDPRIAVSFPEEAPGLAGRPGLRRLRRLARYQRGFDLVLTYNWGAFDAVMARRLFGGPPLIHHEDGFNEDEADRLKRSRNLYRRAGLPAASALVVPSRTLERVARQAWGQRPPKLVRIPNGVPVTLYGDLPTAPIPGLDRRPGEVVVGTVAGLRAIKNLPRLVRAFARAGEPASRLVIVGAGPEREAILAEAQACRIADRLILPGLLAEPWRWIGHFDVFALSSDSEQFPISLVEAMAAGLPAAATAVGDVRSQVDPANLPYIVERSDEAALGAALAALVRDVALRTAIGQANRARAQALFDEPTMIEAYGQLYGDAAGRPEGLVARASSF